MYKLNKCELAEGSLIPDSDPVWYYLAYETELKQFSRASLSPYFKPVMINITTNFKCLQHRPIYSLFKVKL